MKTNNTYKSCSPNNSAIIEFEAKTFEFMDNGNITAYCEDKVIRAIIPVGWAVCLIIQE